MLSSTFRCRTIAFLLVAACSIAQAAPERTAVLVASGDPTPDGSDIITNPNNFAYASGQLIFLAYLQNARLLALFSKGPTAEVEIIRAGDMIAPAGTVTGFAGNLSCNQEGRALFYALTVDGTGMYHPVLATGTGPTDVTPVVIAGQTIPDGNGEFNDFGGWTINNEDEVSFWSSIQNGGGPLLTTNGIFVGHKDGTISELIRSKDPAPGEKNLIYSLGSPTPINPAGQFNFLAEISDSHFGTGNNYGLYLANASGNITRLARSYYPAPGTGYLFGYFVAAKVNDAGVTTFSASLIDSSGGFHGYGIFTATATGLLKTIAYSGQTAPNDLGTYSGFDLSVARSDAGKVAYAGYYQGENQGSGIFVGGGNRQSALALSGQRAPGGSVFSGFGSAGINKSGMVGFAAQLDDSPGFNGIFIIRGKRVLKVAQAGDFVDGVKIDQLSFDPSFFDDLGQVLYLAIDPWGQSRLLLFTPFAAGPMR